MLCVKPTREYIQNLYEAGLYRSAELLGIYLNSFLTTFLPLYMVNSICFDNDYTVFTKNQKVWLCGRGDLTSLFFSKVAK